MVISTSKLNEGQNQTNGWKERRHELVAARRRRLSVRRRERSWAALCVDGFGTWSSLKCSMIRLHSSDDGRCPSVTTYTPGPANIADRLLTYRQSQPTQSSLTQW